MAFDAVSIDLQPAEWGADVQHDLQRIAAHDAAEIEAFRAQIEAGEMQALTVYAEGQRIGSLVWSVMTDHRGKVCVLNALAADHVRGVSVAVEIMRRFQLLALALGCVSVRAWTRRAGLVKVLENAGAATVWHVLEVNPDGFKQQQ